MFIHHIVSAYWLAFAMKESVTESLLCMKNGFPNDLARAYLWQKSLSSDQEIYRIGGVKMKFEGYVPANVSSSHVLLNRGKPTSCSAECVMRLATNRRRLDGIILHQENAIGVPIGYDDISEANGYYCARSYQGCGAELPIYRFQASSALAKYAYSFGYESFFRGYSKELMPICYGWKSDDDLELLRQPSDFLYSIQRAASVPLEIAYTNMCSTAFNISHGQIARRSSERESTFVDYILELKCDEGYISSGTTSILCTNSGWRPSTLFGKCIIDVDVNRNVISTTANHCTPFDDPMNRHYTYSQHQRAGILDGTFAYLHCNDSFVAKSIAYEARCENGRWIPSTLRKCEKKQTEYSHMVAKSVKVILENGNTEIPYHQTRKRQISKNANLCQGSLPIHANGHIIYSNGAFFGPFPSGTKATFLCDIGYYLDGDTVSVCQNGAWQPESIRTCTLGSRIGSTCIVGLAPPLWGRITYSSGNEIGPFLTETVAVLDCISGKPNGDLQSTCIEGRWTPAVLGNCLPGIGGINQQCLTTLPLVLNGNIFYSSGSSTGPFLTFTLATVVCNLGHIIFGSSSSTCMNGVWTPPALGTCATQSGLSITTPRLFTGEALENSVQNHCLFPLSPIPNGQITYSSGLSFPPFVSGTVATLTCTAGTTKVSFSSCHNGMWVPPNLSCLENDVGFPFECTSSIPWIANGQLKFSTGKDPPYHSGTVVSLVCDPGFVASGVSMSTCSNGLWTPSLSAVCTNSNLAPIIHTCTPLTTPLNGQIRYSTNSSVNYSLETTAALICEAGFTPIGDIATICAEGIWKPPTLGECRLGSSKIPTMGTSGDCLEYLPSVANGFVKYSPTTLTPFPHGTGAMLFCITGYMPLANAISACINGIWTPPEFGECGPNGYVRDSVRYEKCTSITHVSHGKVNYIGPASSDSYQLGAVAILSCDQSYIPSGYLIVACGMEGWTPKDGLGTCIMTTNLESKNEQRCPLQPKPQNGNIVYYGEGKNGYELGTRLTLQCDPDYVIVGIPSALCQSGIWTPSIGNCELAQGNPGQNGCGSIAEPANAKIFYIQPGSSVKHGIGTTAVLICDLGYTTLDQDTTTCTANGWSNKIGNCAGSSV